MLKYNVLSMSADGLIGSGIAGFLFAAFWHVDWVGIIVFLSFLCERIVSLFVRKLSINRSPVIRIPRQIDRQLFYEVLAGDHLGHISKGRDKEISEICSILSKKISWIFRSNLIVVAGVIILYDKPLNRITDYGNSISLFLITIGVAFNIAFIYLVRRRIRKVEASLPS